MGKAREAMFGPTPGFDREKSVRCGFAAEGTLIAASTVPHREGSLHAFIAYMYVLPLFLLLRYVRGFSSLGLFIL